MHTVDQHDDAPTAGGHDRRAVRVLRQFVRQSHEARGGGRA